MKSLSSAACIAAALLFSTVATAETVGEKTGINSTFGVAPTTADFVTEAAQSDMFEIQSSKLATTKGDQASQAFAKRMITDHTKTSDQLKSLVSKGEVKATLPTAMSSSQQSMLDKLKSLNGGDFSKQYKSDQLSGHKAAVALFQRYAKGGRNQGLKTWASQTLPTLQEHLKMAQNLDK